MTLSLDLPSCHDSLLGSCDPRWKLAAFVLVLGAVCALRTLPTAGLALAGALMLAGLGGLPGRWLLRRLAWTGLVVLVFAAFLPFVVNRGGSGWGWERIRFSVDGARLAGLLLLKSLALVTLALTLLAVTPLPMLLHAAHRLHLPGLLVQLVLLTYRYVFVLVEELGHLRVALRTRGYRNRMSLHSYRTVGHVTGTLLVRSQERAERVSQAMRCRGFDGKFRSLAEFRTGPADLALFLLVDLAAAGLLLGDFLLS